MCVCEGRDCFPLSLLCMLRLAGTRLAAATATLTITVSRLAANTLTGMEKRHTRNTHTKTKENMSIPPQRRAIRSVDGATSQAGASRDSTRSPTHSAPASGSSIGEHYLQSIRSGLLKVAVPSKAAGMQVTHTQPQHCLNTPVPADTKPVTPFASTYRALLVCLLC